MLDIRKPGISVEELKDNTAQFKVEPLERGFGYTLGNSLRRVLLSSLPGAAITSVKIERVAHEFDTIPGVKEDVIDIILNLKDLVLRLYGDEPATMRINVKGPKEVTAADIEYPAEVEIISPELHIATLNAEGKLEMEMTVESGRGYVSADRNKRPSDTIGVIPVDSIFSPIRSVTYAVENARVGQRTDFDRLVLEVRTNGSITPFEAVSIGAKIVNDHMGLFMEQASEFAATPVFVADVNDRGKALDSPIEDLELSVRSYNCLKREGVNTVQQLVEQSEGDLMKIRNFGAKSIEEVKDKLAQLGLSLKQS
ncbi:MAG: DNA-directed RNA polymerase subunit alpha [Candidatus Aquicultor secundus]|uniref:DNA-directed RNA polymerase subunit alpha n=1 Tax=Candidatus Aquicultor secundus TaxID=1973895 RepID=A0A2M7T9A0_9ACTN|nr:DNA-directed RNA polymerase subunit alpha [Candidatus Aquicultor secundus]NCO65243.1 DNA-directed RNA polymerase subunit alpha [Solirubrobacter sp.]OIO86232.1 MAG: DNA-directed RNA polymerase subunit alpha [Candidatus Aquicultor secundus]PIU26395.1 MAG: DNA-directed RNA polymerase subunit alpha [Candidatus Aquicultor secundus]PIW21425.1 MAG: DNA-directed RNA polymerase subunit alpha [Candidatus Aquicultor secundus]PIX53154.1 MAG: DNA-directed RNA polymerase subunit alpha [Candidatus Aquicul